MCTTRPTLCEAEPQYRPGPSASRVSSLQGRTIEVEVCVSSVSQSQRNELVDKLADDLLVDCSQAQVCRYIITSLLTGNPLSNEKAVQCTGAAMRVQQRSSGAVVLGPAQCSRGGFASCVHGGKTIPMAMTSRHNLHRIYRGGHGSVQSQ